MGAFLQLLLVILPVLYQAPVARALGGRLLYARAVHLNQSTVFSTLGEAADHIVIPYALLYAICPTRLFVSFVFALPVALHTSDRVAIRRSRWRR